MLRIQAGQGRPTCDHISRRDCLQIGARGLGGTVLAGLFGTSARGGARSTGSGSPQLVRPGKAVVVLFLSGGASHIETFNPNMDRPAPYCSATGSVQTSVPGLDFGGTFPQLARHAHQMAVVRSFQHPVGGHVQAIKHVLNGGTDPDGQGTRGFSMGSIYSRLRGPNSPDTGLPSFALLNSEEVDGQYRNERGRVEKASHPGSLGAACGPFIPGGGGPATENMTLNVALERVDDRRALRRQLDRLQRQREIRGELSGFDEQTQQAFDVVLGQAAESLDLTREPSRLLERYDTSGFRVGKKVFRDSQLGHLFLTARRLIEGGCGFLTIHSAGWDMHADSNNPGIVSGMEMLGRPVDKAVSAFLEDLEQRGLLDDVLLVVTGDFGRTPKINSRGGRDHWPRLCTLAFAGGGLNMGQVIGRSGKNNDEPTSDPIQVSNLLGTILHYQFDVGALRLQSGIPRQLMAQIEQSGPIRELF